jgi:fused signal recognition particle receptor
MIGKLFRGLKKTRERLTSGLSRLFSFGRKLDEDFLDELEEILYTSDLGATGSAVVEELKVAWKKKQIENTGQVPEFLRKCLLARLEGCGGALNEAPQSPRVILIVGVNGAGKTTSIAKLANMLKEQGRSVMLCGLSASTSRSSNRIRAPTRRRWRSTRRRRRSRAASTT